MSNVACVSGLSIFGLPLRYSVIFISFFVLCPLLPVSLDCQILITPFAFSNVYFSYFVLSIDLKVGFRFGLLLSFEM